MRGELKGLTCMQGERREGVAISLVSDFPLPPTLSLRRGSMPMYVLCVPLPLSRLQR